MIEGWFQRLKDRLQIIRRRKELKRIVDVLDSFMEEYKSTPTVYDNSMAQFGIIVKLWNFDNGCVLSQSRYLQGDVIEFSKEGRRLAAWADQSFQYDGLMGKNDFEFNPTITLKEINESIAGYTNG